MPKTDSKNAIGSYYRGRKFSGDTQVSPESNDRQRLIDQTVSAAELLQYRNGDDVFSPEMAQVYGTFLVAADITQRKVN